VAAVERNSSALLGFELPRLGFGTAPLGGLYDAVGETQAAAALDRGFSDGIAYFDTAPHYGSGVAEERLGAAIARAGRIPLLSTKIGYSFKETDKPDEFFIDAPQVEAYVDWSEAGIERGFELSLERLGVDRVDILFLHDTLTGDFEDMVRVGAAAARRWQDEGLVTAVGAGMNYAKDAIALLEQVELDCLLVAGRVSLLDQTAVGELLPLCEARGVSVIAGGVFNSGILARPDASARYDYAPAPPDLVARAQKIGTVCERHGVPLAAAALQYPLQFPAVVTVIPGMRSVDEVDVNLRLFEHAIPDALWDELEAEGLVDQRRPHSS
jgi:D-threo-aldose 1-dehydrogenase